MTRKCKLRGKEVDFSEPWCDHETMEESAWLDIQSRQRQAAVEEVANDAVEQAAVELGASAGKFLTAQVILGLVLMVAPVVKAEPVSAFLATPLVAKILGNLQAHAIGMHGTQEFATAIQDDGTYRIVVGEDGKLASQVTTNTHTVLIAHTHPDGSVAAPSAADIEAAKRTGIPDVVISRYSMYLILTDGTVQKLR